MTVRNVWKALFLLRPRYSSFRITASLPVIPGKRETRSYKTRWTTFSWASGWRDSNDIAGAFWKGVTETTKHDHQPAGEVHLDKHLDGQPDTCQQKIVSLIKVRRYFSYICINVRIIWVRTRILNGKKTGGTNTWKRANDYLLYRRSFTVIVTTCGWKVYTSHWICCPKWKRYQFGRSKNIEYQPDYCIPLVATNGNMAGNAGRYGQKHLLYDKRFAKRFTNAPKISSSLSLSCIYSLLPANYK